MILIFLGIYMEINQEIWQPMGLMTWSYETSSPGQWVLEGLHGVMVWSFEREIPFLHQVCRAWQLRPIEATQGVAEVIWGAGVCKDSSRTLSLNSPEFYVDHPDQQAELWLACLAFEQKGWYTAERESGEQ